MASADVRKAAILLTSLPDDEAAGLLARLEPDEARAVIAEMALRETIDAEERRGVILEFAAEAAGREPAERFAAPFERLAETDAETLSVFLAGEHPQTIALVLAHLPAQLGGDILSSLPAEVHATVVGRIASMSAVDPAVVADVAFVLVRRCRDTAAACLDNPGGTLRAAALLRLADCATGQSVLTNLAHDDPALAGEIRRSAFVFDDVARLSRRDLERLARYVSSDQWAAALAGADERCATGLLDNLPSRARRRARTALERCRGRAASALEIATAREQILSVAVRLDLASRVPLAAAG